MSLLGSGVSALFSAFGAADEAHAKKRQQQIANQILAKILPVQQQQFNTRYDLTNVVNGLLMGNETNRYNTTGTADTAVRNNLADESKARFDEQASAVGGQITDDTAHAGALINAISNAIHGSDAAYTDERGRQLTYQGTADAGAQALLGNIGVPADTTNRAAAEAARNALAASTIGAADTGGATPDAHSRVQAEFAKRGTAAQASALASAAAGAHASAYGDARSIDDSTLSSFVGAMNALKAKAASSAGALGPELTSINRGATNAVGEFDRSKALTDTIGSNAAHLADVTHSGNMTAISNAGDAEDASMSAFFQRLAQNYQTGYGGQIDASQRYENGLTDIFQNAASRVLGQNPTSNLSTIGSLLNSVQTALPGLTGG